MHSLRQKVLSLVAIGMAVASLGGVMAGAASAATPGGPPTLRPPGSGIAIVAPGPPTHLLG
jgi:hypothetical protein